MKKSIFIFSLLLLSGCATIFSGSTQSVHIKVVDTTTNDMLNGATCVVIDANGGSSALASNPGAVNVARGNGALSVSCKKEGYRQLNTSVGDSFNAVSLVNILFWPGFFVDLATGAHKKYPSHYVVSMEKIVAAH